MKVLPPFRSVKAQSLCTSEVSFGGEQLEMLISVDEAARRLGGISKWTVHAWLSQGRLQRTKVGARTMIRESELLKVIQEGGKSPSPNRGSQDK